MPVVNPEALIENRVAALQQYHAETGILRAELDVSGGLDSAVMLGLLAKALGPDNVTAAFLGINSSPDALARAKEVAATFGVKLIILDATEVYQNLVGRMQSAMLAAGFDVFEIEARLAKDKTILGGFRSCFRAPLGRAFNRMAGGGIRHGTGNEDEDRWMRFYQKGGDGEVDTNPIAMLSKGEVFQVARVLGVPMSILNARPSPDLWGIGEKHNDEDEIKAYLGLPADCPYTMYSYIDMATGEYTSVGLIERVSRWLDQTDDLLFTHDEFVADRATEPGVLKGYHQFDGIDPDTAKKVLMGARKVEAMTRHKWNPNCPSLGDRADLVAAGILTNELPV